MRDIIVDECELSVAANTVQRCTNRLLEVMNSYNAILATLQSEGIKDEAICAQFSAIVEEMTFCGQQLETNISTIGTTVNRGIERMEEVDSFKFPSTVLVELVEQLIAAVN